MDFEETVKEIIREEVRAMLYKQNKESFDLSIMIPVRKSSDSLDEEYSFNRINELIEEAMEATGCKSKSDLFRKVFSFSRANAFNLLNQFKKYPNLRTNARMKFVETLKKAIKGESCEYDV